MEENKIISDENLIKFFPKENLENMAQLFSNGSFQELLNKYFYINSNQNNNKKEFNIELFEKILLEDEFSQQIILTLVLFCLLKSKEEPKEIQIVLEKYNYPIDDMIFPLNFLIIKFYIKSNNIQKAIDNINKLITKYEEYNMSIAGKEGKNTLRRFITAVLNQYYKGSKQEYKLVTGGTNNSFINELCDLRSELMDSLNIEPYVHDGFVVPNSGLMEAIEKSCLDRFKIKYSWTAEDKLFDKDTTNGINEYMVMFDRDYHSEYRTHEMYKETLQFCDEFGYHPLVSTPQFELWLLMHFYGVDYGKPSFDKYKFYLLRQLELFDNNVGTSFEKRMDPERFNDYYKDNILHAADEADLDLFENDPILLMDHPGTNLGIFFKGILKQEDSSI